ncbi:MAG: N-acetylmuramoyl-L-alanine amidase-like domain-containing protein [Rhodothermales bacterium]
MQFFTLIALFLAGPSVSASDAVEPDSTTQRLFEETMAFAREHRLHEMPMGEIMTTLGERFVDSPYVAGMLDEPAEETLVCRLDGFDCVTFVESTLAMARAIKQEQYDYETWTGFIRDQRYRDGKMDGYCSRLHFFTEWILDNEKRGTVRDITLEVGGVLLDKKIDFMTTHRESYPRISKNDSLFACIQEMESNLEDAKIYYIPQDRIHEVYDQLQSGDIIATATHLKGLDVTHTGLVYDSGDGKKGLLHASASGSVKVSPDLQAYVQGVKVTIGIIVARPQSPRKS